MHIKYIDTEIDINYDINSKYTEPDIKYVCINLPNINEELFFSFRCGGDHHLLKGIYYNVKVKYTTPFLPLRIEDDFEYLTYYIISYEVPNQKLNIYFAICEDYPLCTKIKKDYIINNITINQYLNTYTIILSRDNINKSYFDLIRKKRFLLFVECLNKKDRCYFYINIYSDKTKIYQGKEIKHIFDDFYAYEFSNEPNLQYKFLKIK